jgi:hypothetical protein
LIDIDLRRAVIPLALFFGTFAWSVVSVNLPVVLAVSGLACVPFAGRGVRVGREAVP